MSAPGTVTMATISVCVDCYVTHHYGEASSDPDYVPDRAPLSLIGEGVTVWDGCLDCDPCGHDDCTGSRVCGCGYGDRGHGFSWSACEGCDSRLGGDRFALVVSDA